jgi:hypothetical protein
MDSSKPRKLPYQMADYQSRCCFLYTHFVLAAANIVNTFTATGRVLLKTLKFWIADVLSSFDENIFVGKINRMRLTVEWDKKF